MSLNVAKVSGPTSHTYFSQRLRLHYVDWGNPEAPPMLLIHGSRDHCRNWDWVAERFRDDYHVIAPDLRGHGDSQWLQGGSYNFIEYVLDVAQLVDQKQLGPLTVIGHSLGAAVSLGYTALHPEQVTKLACIEATGPMRSMAGDNGEKLLQDSVHEWINDLRARSATTPRRYESLDAALNRMREKNPHLSEDQAMHLTIHGTNQNEDGTYSWKFDRYVNAWPPLRPPTKAILSLYKNIRCPTLFAHGDESWVSNPVDDDRLEYFSCPVRIENFPAAGHWLHHDQLEMFVEKVKDFLQDD